MDNLFQSKKYLIQQEQQEAKNQKEQKKKKFKETFNSLSSSRFQNKLMTFVKEDGAQTILESFQEGSYPLINPDFHNFRDRQKEQERDQYGGIYLRTYQIGSERAAETQQEFLSSHLEGQIYNSHPPHLHPTISWLRIRDLKKEGPPLRYNNRIENENLLKNIEINTQKIDHSSRDMKMVHDPDWKQKNKQKWVNYNKGFDCSTKSSLKWSSNPPWPQIPIGPTDPYMGGFKQIEDKLGRHRDKKKEVNILFNIYYFTDVSKIFLKPKRNDFIGRVKDDPWESTLNISKSIRTLKAEQVMHGDPERFMFSKNNKLDQSSYKPSLIETKSVDRLTPFNHSNNFQSLQLKNMGQNFPRIYKNSLVHYGLIEKQQNSVNHSKNNNNSFLYDNAQQSHTSRTGSANKKMFFDDRKLLQKAHQMSNQSLEKNKRLPTQQAEDFRYNPPSDKQVQDVVCKYFQK
ncbi:hypothetical protein ABPG72_004355 [Tetrahymena utriculariae]